MSNQPLCHQVVGHEHVFLHQAIGISHWVGRAKAGRFPITLELEGQFDAIESQGSIEKSKSTTRHGDLVHETDIERNVVHGVTSRWLTTFGPKSFVHLSCRLTISNLGVDNVLSCGIVQSSTRLDDGSSIPHILWHTTAFLIVVRQRSVHIHFPHTRKGQSFDIFIQTARHLTEWSWQHGNDAIDQIDGRGAPRRFHVDG
mmetsp:Transcript_24168/g.40012  ORF Transcript_24168/g.40012 Transcript_24168/m.40012 type:complete len:200 (+) Transcript_24168:868-1467(+)